MRDGILDRFWLDAPLGEHHVEDLALEARETDGLLTVDERDDQVARAVRAFDWL